VAWRFLRNAPDAKQIMGMMTETQVANISKMKVQPGMLMKTKMGTNCHVELIP